MTEFITHRDPEASLWQSAVDEAIARSEVPPSGPADEEAPGPALPPPTHPFARVAASAATLLHALALVVALTVLMAIVGWSRPRSGVKPVVLFGSLIVLAFVVVRLTAGQGTLSNRKVLSDLVAETNRAGAAEERGAAEKGGAGESDPRRVAAPRVSERALDRATLQLSEDWLTRAPDEPFTDFIQKDEAAKQRLAQLGCGQHPAQGAPAPGAGKPKMPAPQGAPPKDNRLGPDADALGEDGATGEPPALPLWPLFLVGPAFLYLWWIAAVIFELAVVWHYYIRWSGILPRLEALDPDLRRACT